MSDPIPWLVTIALTLPLLLLAVYDVDTARFLRNAERLPPAVELLRLFKDVIYAVTLAAILAAVLGIHSVLFLLTGFRLLPQPIPVVMIYAIAIVASLMVYRLRRWIRSQ